MADDKKYYYLKLKENFFEREEITVIESMQNGYKYSNILLKMYLKSLKREGKLMVTDCIPYNLQSLAAVLGHDQDTVNSAINLFKDFKLIEILDNGQIYMNEIQNFVGLSSTEADRKREYRAKIDRELKELPEGQMSGQKSDKNPPEIELEIEIELEKEIIPYQDIIDLLNQKAGTKFRVTDKHKECIRARWKEGYCLTDFIIVIDKKFKEWAGTEQAKYIRPITLFGTKFDGYLNQVEGGSKFGENRKFTGQAKTNVTAKSSTPSRSRKASEWED